MARHSNRYKYWYDDDTYSLDDMKEYFGSGWHDLLEKAFNWVNHFPNTKIRTAKRCYGMLHIYAKCEDEYYMPAVEGVLWKVERLSTRICETCGGHGVRRKELKSMYCLCNDCYLVHLNKVENPMSLFREGHEGRF